MREGWKYKKLKELCSFINDGDWIESKDQSESGIRLIQTGNIGNGIYKDKEDRSKYISENTFNSLGCTEIIEGDCLVSRLPEPIGRCCLLPKMEKRCITAVDCSIIRFKDEMFPKYFVYYSQSTPYAADIENKTTGTTRKRISRKNLEGISIPTPHLTLQQSIVAELDEINNLLNLKRKQLETYDKLAQSLFYEMFGDPVENEKGWEVKKLGEIADVINGFAFKSDLFKPEGLPIVRISNIQNKQITNDCVYFNPADYSVDFNKYKVKPQRILIAMSGATTGKCGRNETNLTYYLNQRVGMFVEKEKYIVNSYLFYFLQSKADESLNIAMGVAQPNLSTSQIRDYRVPLPPLNLQQTFATRIEAIEQQKKNVKAAIEKLETLLSSRMDYWFFVQPVAEQVVEKYFAENNIEKE